MLIKQENKMKNLTKITDMSTKYGISARTLRYYEDIGLITSSRTNDYAYRLYDETAGKKLEQILILRKLNISIKDINRIFNSTGSEIVLDVLSKKVDDIDNEVSLLHELKQIVLTFIRHIEKIDFNKEADVKKLYDSAEEIEQQLVNVEYEGNKSSFIRLLEVHDKLKQRQQHVMITNLPSGRAVTSGWVWWDDDIMNEGGFNQWAWANKHLFKEAFFNSAIYYVERSADFHGGMVCMNFMVNDNVTEAEIAPYKFVDFEGGIYAYMHGLESDAEYCDVMYYNILKWLEDSEFERDESRDLFAQSTCLGTKWEIWKSYKQFQRYVPIKVRTGMKNAVSIYGKNEQKAIIKKFFTAFNEKFGGNLERHYTDFDFDKAEDDCAHVAYVVKKDVKAGVSVVLQLNADKHDPCAFIGFAMLNKKQEYFGDKLIVNDLRKHYGIKEKKLTEHYICFEPLIFEEEEIKLINSDNGYGNYLKLFDSKKFDEIVDSAVKQAKKFFDKLR